MELTGQGSFAFRNKKERLTSTSEKTTGSLVEDNLGNVPQLLLNAGQFRFFTYTFGVGHKVSVFK